MKQGILLYFSTLSAFSSPMQKKTESRKKNHHQKQEPQKPSILTQKPRPP